jgi:uncharacterized protein YxeA
MKKIIILLLIVLFLVTGAGFGENQKEEKEKKQSTYSEAVTKTYTLKHVSPKVVHRTLRQYFWESSYAPNGNMFTVKIARKNIPGFEKLLGQLDVARRKILVRIFTVIASKEGKSSPIPNKDLQQVLGELQKVLSFKAFHLDGVSAITVQENQDGSRLVLSSHSPLELRLEDIYIKGQKKGERTVGFEFALKKREKLINTTDTNQWNDTTLIASETSVKENGYLVAGVSRIGNGDSLVLIINAEIK